MVGIYLSGTGNTKHCIQKFIVGLDSDSKCIPIEDKESIDTVRKSDTIVIAYPTQFSNVPFMVRDFTIKNKDIWKGKKVFIITTMGAFSGDGTGCLARVLKRYGSMIEKTITDIKQAGKYPKEGLSILAHMAGLFGQRLWFYNKTADYSENLKISDSCIGCGICESNCPMGNLSIQNGKAVNLGKCTMCYRCISTCPKKAITLLGKEVVEQCRYEKYI